MTEPEKTHPGDPLTPPPAGAMPNAGGPDAPEPTVSSDQDSPPTSAQESDETVGTGSAIALGCIAGTLLLIVLGLLFLAAVALLT